MPNGCIKTKSTNLEKKKKRCRNVKPKPERTTIKRSVSTGNGCLEKDGSFWCLPPASPEGEDTPQIARSSLSFKRPQEEINKGITQCIGPASSDSGVSETGSEEQTQKTMPPCKKICCKPPYTPTSNTSKQRFDSLPNEKLPTIIKSSTPIKANTPVVLMEYVPTPTSAIKGKRKRRLNFGDVEEGEKESLPRRRTKVVEVPKRKETKNTKKFNKTIL